ncbi:hypothetical protein TNCV_1138161 [Trichonephila clavipes]|nr:hypothetical protein TNCV_1138161 [Trichonephila clavipes]
MDVCKYIVSSRHGSTLNSRRAVSPLVRLVAGDQNDDEILEAYLRLLRGAMDPDYILDDTMDDNAWPLRAHVVNKCHKEEDIRHMD